MAKKKAIATAGQYISNGLSDIAFGLSATKQLSSVDTIRLNNREYLVSNDRPTLSYAYSTYGIIQTLIDQPIDDAFRGGFMIKSNQLDDNDIYELQNYITKNDVLEVIKESAKWSRLFGGAGIIINTVGNSNQPLNINQINKNTPLKFYAADLWELNRVNEGSYTEEKPYIEGSGQATYYYYGKEIHSSRINIINGKTAPSLLRPQLRGWGMSEVERIIRSFNQYLKNNNVIFELLDEAKVDIYSIEGLNDRIATPDGSRKTLQILQAMNQIKSYQNAIVKDKADEYEQKSLTFTGLAEVLREIRIGIAADVKMPVNKLFGQSATGFSSGQDSIENYNSMIESEIRGKYDSIIINILKLCCKKLFDVVIDDLDIEYYPLRQLTADQEATVNNTIINNILSLLDRGIISNEQAIQEINKRNILMTQIDE